MSRKKLPGRIVVLGHTGFIGRHVVRELRNRFPNNRINGLATKEVDLTKKAQVKLLSQHFTEDTAVIMLAGVKRQLGDNLGTFHRNLSIAMNVATQLETLPVKRFVFFSSAAVYGEERSHNRIDEKTPVSPTSYYGAAKYASECLFREAAKRNGITSLLTIRPPLIYGPGDRSNSYGPCSFLKAAIRGEPVLLWGDGSERRDFVYVEDVAQITCILALGENEGTVNLATGQSVSFFEVIEQVNSAIGKKITVAHRPRTKPQVDHVFDNSLLRKLLPDYSFTPLEVGIRKMLQDAEKN